jgi:hypothetical protein
MAHPEAACGCRAREGGRVGSTKVVMRQQVLGGGGGEMSSERSKNAFVFCFRLHVCVWAFGG